jgi:hypothetical protein
MKRKYEQLGSMDPEAKTVPLSNNNHYVNSGGNIVHSQARAPSLPFAAYAVWGTVHIGLANTPGEHVHITAV